MQGHARSAGIGEDDLGPQIDQRLDDDVGARDELIGDTRFADSSHGKTLDELDKTAHQGH